MNGNEAVLAIHKNIESLRKDVSHVMTDGCAKREGDLQRIISTERQLESLGRKMDKIFYTSLVTAIGIIAFLAKALLPYIIRGVSP